MKARILELLKVLGIWCFRMYYKLRGKQIKNIVGIPYQRDPDSICEAYEPFARGLTHFKDCETDGHYLCKNCCHKKTYES